MVPFWCLHWSIAECHSLSPSIPIQPINRQSSWGTLFTDSPQFSNKKTIKRNKRLNCVNGRHRLSLSSSMELGLDLLAPSYQTRHCNSSSRAFKWIMFLFVASSACSTKIKIKIWPQWLHGWVANSNELDWRWLCGAAVITLFFISGKTNWWRGKIRSIKQHFLDIGECWRYYFGKYTNWFKLNESNSDDNGGGDRGVMTTGTGECLASNLHTFHEWVMWGILYDRR